MRWRDWARINKVPKLNLSRGLRFDRSFMSVGAAVDGLGVCLDSTLMAQREIESGALVAPFGLDGLKVQGYSFNILKSSADLFSRIFPSSTTIRRMCSRNHRSILESP